MTKRHRLREIQRLQGSRQPLQGQPISAELLQTYLERSDQLEVVQLLQHNSTNWQRRYQPRPEHQSTVSAVLVRCVGELAAVELLPV